MRISSQNEIEEKKADSNKIYSYMVIIKASAKKHKSYSIVPSLMLGVALWYLPPLSPELTNQSMHVLAVFIAFIVAMLTSKYKVSILIGVALSFLSITLNVSCPGGDNKCKLINKINVSASRKAAFETVTKGFSNSVVWMIFCAFQIGKAVELTGLGNRLSLYLLKYFGRKSIVGVAYSFCVSEIVLAMFVPSNSARGGGVILPIVISTIELIKKNAQSNEKSDKKLGSTFSYLILVAAHANLISSSMFLTGLAPNPLVTKEASAILGIDVDFYEWLKGSCIPALVSVVLLPLVLYYVLRPSGYNAAHATKHVDETIKKLGKITINEYKLIIVLFGCLLFWSLGTMLGLSEAYVAFTGLFAMVLLNVISWDDVVKNHQSWDTIFWLAGFSVLANELKNFKIASYLGETTKNLVGSSALPKELGCILLGFIYFISMFLFSSTMGHVAALVSVFFEAAGKLGYPPRLITAIVAYFTALCCCTTNYSTGPFVIYFEKGYVAKQKWFLVGLVMMIFFLSIYSSIGMLWWKILGYY